MPKEWPVKLNTGAIIPAFGLGTWNSKPGEVATAVEAALRAGYRHIDCAHIYGNEGEIGGALLKCFKEGVVKREDVFVTSKLWSADHAREDVLPACKKTLENLRLDYIDLYLIHTPARMDKTTGAPLTYDPDSATETWAAMEELVAHGLVRAIGVSNFTITKLEYLLRTAKIVPAVNQVESHPYFQQQKLKDYCDTKGIVFEAYSPLGSPSRPTKGDADPIVMEDPIIVELAEKYGATPGQICISFALHRGLVVIPKTVNPARIVENFKSTDVALTSEDMERLTAIDKNHRLIDGRLYLPKGHTVEEAWDVEADAKFIIKKD